MVAIHVEGLSKRYALYRSPRDRIWEWLSFGRRVYHRPFWALREVGFSVPAGSALGVIGPNGAGKSTLLGILAGTIQATSGTAMVRGRVSALLELGNILGCAYLNALSRLLGLSLLPSIPGLRILQLRDYLDSRV